MSTTPMITSSPVMETTPKEPEIEYKTAEEHGSLSKDDFMMLFVTELQYQDPMNPMESAEMASQMAQFNSLDLLYKNNEAMEKLVDTYEASMGISAVSLLGHSVYFQGDSLVLDSEGEAQTFYMDLETEAADAAVEIRDASGDIVQTLVLGPMSAGRNEIAWDGTDMNGEPVPAGTYTLRAAAVNADGDEIPLDFWLEGRVTKIEYDEDGNLKLQVDGGSQVSWEEIWTVA